MIRPVILLMSFILCYATVMAQAIEQPAETTNTSAIDTTLFNHYLNEATRLSERYPDSVQVYLNRAFRLAQKTSYSKGLAAYYHFLTAEHNEQSHYDAAMQTAKKELHWAIQSKDSTSQAWAYNAIANVHEYLGNVDSSVVNFVHALQLVDPMKNEKLFGTLNYNLASAFTLNGDYTQALHYAQKGYQISKRLKNTHMMSNSLLDMGSIEAELKNYEKALTYFNQVIDMVRNTPDSLTIMDALNDEGDVLAKEKKYRESLEKYQKMLRMATRTQTQYYLLYAYGNLGITRYQLHQLPEAESNLKKAIEIGETMGAKNELRQFYQSLSQVKEAQKQYGPALKYRKKYDALNDSLMSEASRKNIHSLEIKYNTAQKNKRIAQQNLELSQKQRSIERRDTWLIIFIGGLLALTIILILSVRNYRHKRKLQEQSVLALQKQHEVNILKAKMQAREEERDRIGKEMHDDIGSALTTILYLTEDMRRQDGGAEKLAANRIFSIADSVVDKMNEIIWSMNRQYDTLDDLIAYTRQHAASFLRDHQLKYHFDAPQPVPNIHLRGEQRRNMYLVIKEALHNIVKHACATKVSITFDVKEELAVIIHDNGNGIDTKVLHRFGNGLRNMRQRMESTGGRFEIISEKGTTITLQYPLEGTKAQIPKCKQNSSV